MPMRPCTVNMATCLTASKRNLSRGRGGQAATQESLEAMWVVPWQRHWRCLWPSAGSDSGNSLLLRAASMLHLLGHPGYQLPSTLIPPDFDSRSQTSLGWVESRPELKPGGLRLHHTGR